MVGIFDLNLKNKKDIEIAEVDPNVFMKIFHIKKEIGAYIYFDKNNKPNIQIKKINNDHDGLEDVFNSIVLNADERYTLNKGLFYSDGIKLNDNKFAVILTTNDLLNLLICIFDLYNNDNSFRLRYYYLELNSKNIMISVNIRAFKFGNFLGISFYDSNSESPGYFLINFPNLNNENNYLNNTYSEIKLFTNSSNYILSFPEIILENNIFGGEIIKIKIVNFEDAYNSGVIITSSNLDKEISINDELELNDQLLFEPNYIGAIPGEYILYYSPIIKESESNDINYNPDLIEYYGETTINYESKTFEGNIFRIIYSIECYEKCKTCNQLGSESFYYCVQCKDEYPYYVNITDNGNDFYISCYRQCPKHAPYLKEANSIECLSQCPKYKTIDKFCVDNCDYEVYKYLFKENKTCFNYIPNNYSLYIDNYTEFYDNSNSSIINIINECPNDFDSSFKNYCINLTKDIYHLIPDPNELIEYDDPLIITLEAKNITIRAYSSDSKSDDLKYYDNKLFKVDISACEKKLKEYYNISQEESIIIYDVNNIDNDDYLFKIFSSKGEELSHNICTENNIAINIIDYYTKKSLNETKCPKEYPYYNTLNDKCIKYCDIDAYLNKTCITDFINTANKEKNINYIKDSIKSYLITPMLDNITNLGEDIIIEEEGIKYHLTSSSNQNNKIYQNISSIYLGNCENKLKEKYNINQNQSLLIYKVDIDIEGYFAPIVEYEVYHPITKQKLDLSCCNEDQIKISTPANIDINENEITKYDPKSDFYNDICSTYTTKYNTDITLKDRQKEFFNNNMSLCEDNCDFISYDSSSKKIDCNCNIKLTIKDLSNIKINKDTLKSKFNIKNMINIEVIKCYKKLFCKEGILYNIGSYILLAIILFFIIGFIIFINKEFASLQKEIELYIKYDINNEDQIVSNLGKKTYIKRVIKKIKIKKKIKKGQKKEIDDRLNIPKSHMILNIINKNQKKFDIKNDNINFSDTITENDDNNDENIIDNNDSNKNNIIIQNEKLLMNDYELNECEYKDAIKYDKRTYFNYFYSLLKLNHILLFAIIPQKDYNSKIIKFCLFLFSFSFNLTIEALFYDEEKMSNIYEIKGVYDIIEQIPEIIYTSIISSFIDIIIKYFALSQKYVIEQKNKKTKENNELKYKRIVNNLYKRFILFYIFSFLLLLFFWYYVSCFCAVFKNTQIHLIKDVLLGFGLSLIYPFVSYALSGIFRIFSLRIEKECIYKFSNLIII